MTRESKIAILGFSLGFVLFIGLQRLVFNKSDRGSKMPKKVPSNQDLEVAGSAYAEALANNEDAATLAALNQQFATEYDVQVTQKKADGSIIITDMAGNKIATFQPT